MLFTYLKESGYISGFVLFCIIKISFVTEITQIAKFSSSALFEITINFSIIINGEFSPIKIRLAIVFSL